MDNLDSVINALDAAKKKSANGGEYWMARDIQPILGYSASWENFKNVIDKARMACESAGYDSSDHFHDIMKVIQAAKGAMGKRGDCFLTRYACYLIAMNGASSKPEIGIAQTYFAVQTRRQEIQDKLTDAERRLMLRDRVKSENRNLAGTAKNAGVQRFGLFQDAGYRGLYEMCLPDIMKHKGLQIKDKLLDRMGSTELAANEFRITQTKDQLEQRNISSEKKAIDVHFEVGQEIRNTIQKIGGVMPENLAPEEPIQKLTSRLKKSLSNKKITKLT